MEPFFNQSFYDGWAPSLNSANRYASRPPDAPETFANEPNAAEVSSDWRCAACDSGEMVEIMDSWECLACGSTEFYNVHRSQRTVTENGTWLYMPHASQPEASPSSSSARRRRRRRQRVRDGEGPPDRVGNEQAESEVLTHDTCVDPSLHMSPPHSGPSEQVRAPHGADDLAGDGRVHRPGHQPDSVPKERPAKLFAPTSKTDELSTLTKKDNADEVGEWSLKKGPEPGIRWRTGQQPSPPVWKYESSDLRAFAKYKKKVEIWQIQMSPYASASDQALILYGSLSGDAEQELEHLSISEVHQPNGIELILQKLQTPFEQRTIFQKRKFIHEYEMLKRYQGEVMRTYISRFRRALRNLRSVGIEMTSAYDSEALGSRLLDRSGLSAEAQRLILVGTHQSLDLELIAEALVLQYPDFRGAPPIHQLSKGSGKGKDGSTTASSSSASSSRPQFPKRTSPPTAKVFLTGANEGSIEELPDEDEPQDQPADDDDEPDQSDSRDPELDDDDEELVEDDDEDLAELSRVLTVTAKKLSGMTLGRKYTSKPQQLQQSSNISKKKANSHCMACGQKGHWKGDSNCPVSSKSSSSYRNDAKQKPDNKFQQKPSQSSGQKSHALTVVHHEHGRVQVFDPQDFGNMFSCGMVHSISEYQVHEVQAFSPSDFIGKLILDSGCQRNCCGDEWFRAHDSRLQSQFKLSSHAVVCKDVFQFGKGNPLTAQRRAYIPVGFGHQCVFLLGAAVLDANIPLLGSHKLLEELQAIIDMPKKTLRCQRLQVSLPIEVVSGHLVIDIAQFPQHVKPHLLSQWKQLSHPDVWHEPDPNCVFPQQPSMVQFDKTANVQSSPSPDVHNSSAMVAGLAKTGGVPRGLQEGSLHTHDWSGEASFDAEKLARGSSATAVGTQDEASRLPPSTLPSIREHARSLRTMPRVRPQMEVEPRSREVGRFPWVNRLLYAVAAIAVSVLDDGNSPFSSFQDQGQAEAQVITDPNYFRPYSGATTNPEFGDGDGIPGLGIHNILGGPAAHASGHGTEPDALHPGALHRSPADHRHEQRRCPHPQQFAPHGHSNGQPRG